MYAAGIEHEHVDDAHLCAAIRESSAAGIFVVDEESAKEWVDFCEYYDYTLWQSRLSSLTAESQESPLPWED
jgi:hypothetical protein